MGSLDKLRDHNKGDGICETCGNLDQITKTAFGCIANDKLILPDFPPYFRPAHRKCPDYKIREVTNG